MLEETPISPIESLNESSLINETITTSLSSSSPSLMPLKSNKFENVKQLNDIKKEFEVINFI